MVTRNLVAGIISASNILAIVLVVAMNPGTVVLGAIHLLGYFAIAIVGWAVLYSALKRLLGDISDERG